MRRIADDLSLPVLSVGVRALSAAEARFIKTRGIGLLPGEALSDWRRHLPPLLAALPRTVYLTVDMDFFDPAVVPGVGTPEPGGASREEAEGIIAAVTAARDLAGCDVVELCPPREGKKSVQAAVRTVQIALDGARRLAGRAD
jgi:agmatinase